ncbi:Protein kinase domain [Rhizoctonia solani]|uniref:Protein kinase domain n=1 Tax=Rhizoctonia solani TaxID=456999 RepID=A0A8H7H352_9AGAM|nr:Protein kinase domain [Rhizoctonia solani]
MSELNSRLLNIGITSSGPEQRTEAEERWASYEPYLLSKGYQLRPRYRQNWVPSWETSGASPYDCEDKGDTLAIRVLDATRLSDNAQVILKIHTPSSEDRSGLEEIEILQRFSSPEFKDDPLNHVVPCLDVFPIPNIPEGSFIVMPLLSKYNLPEFWDLREVYDFLEQIFEGLEFLHRNNVVHCDIASPNILMDARPLYTEPFHPFFQTRALDGKRPLYPTYLRSQKPVRYYFIDFGYGKQFKEGEEKKVIGWKAREQTPEQAEGIPYDPFLADIYQLGAIIRRDLIPRISTLRFLLPLARQMTHTTPSKRPSLAAARKEMNMHFAGLSGRQKRWPIVPLNVSFRHKCLFFLAGMTAEVVLARSVIETDSGICSYDGLIHTAHTPLRHKPTQPRLT